MTECPPAVEQTSHAVRSTPFPSSTPCRQHTQVCISDCKVHPRYIHPPLFQSSSTQTDPLQHLSITVLLVISSCLRNEPPHPLIGWKSHLLRTKNLPGETRR